MGKDKWKKNNFFLFALFQTKTFYIQKRFLSFANIFDYDKPFFWVHYLGIEMFLFVFSLLDLSILMRIKIKFVESL